jgi:hypothetical protein
LRLLLWQDITAVCDAVKTAMKAEIIPAKDMGLNREASKAANTHFPRVQSDFTAFLSINFDPNYVTTVFSCLKHHSV